VSTKMLPRGIVNVVQFSVPIFMAAVLCFAPAVAEAGLYEFSTIADTTGQFFDFGMWPAINGSGQVIFTASLKTGGVGLYLSNGSTTTTIDYKTVGGLIDTLGGDQVINNSGEVAFIPGMLAFPETSVLKWSGGAITTIADTSGPYSAFVDQPVVTNSGTVGFFGTTDSGQTGIWTGPDPIADKVVQTGDSINGSVLTDVAAFGWKLSDNGNATFRGDTQTALGIYAARPVPEPSTLGLLGAALLCLVACTRRCREG